MTTQTRGIETEPTQPLLLRNAGILGLHAACLLVFFVPVTPLALALAVFSHGIRAFGLTAGYHRYFAHSAYKTGRGTRFFLALLGTTAAQLGPLWWAGHHVVHHRYVDSDMDVHSPVAQGRIWSHIGWFLSGRFMKTNPALAKRFQEYPEIGFLDRHPKLPVLGFALLMAGLGALAGWLWPGTRASAGQFLVWGFIVPTVTLYHATFAVNSLCHMWGYRCYDTPDHSRNNPLVALFAVGEGWHNNHHRYPGSAKQGVKAWEIDPTYLGLRLMEKLGLVWDLRPRPQAIIDEAKPHRPSRGKREK